MFRFRPFPRITLPAFLPNTLWLGTQAVVWLAVFVAGFAWMNRTVATDPPRAPRSATPSVRPTQYHLLPPARDRKLERMPTVEDLVPVLDEPPIISLQSGSRQSQAAAFDHNDWPQTQAAYGRDRFRHVPAMPETIGAFRPARIPPKYADTRHAETPHAETWPADTRITHARSAESAAESPIVESFAQNNASRSGIRTSLFQAIKNPFVTQPVVRPVVQVDHSMSVLVPVPDPTTSPSVAWESESEPPPFAAAVESEPDHAIHSSIIPSDEGGCESCQSVFQPDSDWLFGSQPTAIVSHRETTVRLDALVWWGNSSSLPAVATTSPAGTALGVAGTLNSAGTTSLFDDNAFAQATGGYRIEIDHDLEGFGGIDFEFLQLGTRSETLHASSDQFPILARPFTERQTGNPSASVIAYPGHSVGAVRVSMDSRFRTASAHYYQLAMEESLRSIDDQLIAKFKIGPRIASLEESLRAQDHSLNLIDGGVRQRTDSMRTENLFVGGEIGMLLNRRFRYVDLSAGLSLALGGNRQKYRANGSSELTDAAGLTTTTDSGWLTSSIGSGKISRNRFSVMPSAEFGIGFETQWGWRLSFGYDVMLWTNALRVTEQLHSELNTTSSGVSGSALRPFPSLKNDSYLAHGISIGMERRW